MIELTAAYLTTEAEALAQRISDMHKTQIRRFYDDLKILERKLETGGSTFPDILPLIKFQKAKIAYAAGRKSQGKVLVSDPFRTHMNTQLDKIDDEKSFKNFLLHFQAIIGFFTFFSENRPPQGGGGYQGHRPGGGAQGRPGNKPYGNQGYNRR